MNKKIIGLMKDETGGKQITEFVCLRPKMYAFRINDIEKKTCKGIPKTTIEKDIKLENYLRCLYNDTTKQTTSNVIRSYNHTMYTQKLTKTALNSNDDKRVILEDKIKTLPIGHWRVIGDCVLPETLLLPEDGTLCRLALNVL